MNPLLTRLRIGQEFVHPGTGHRFRITDVGTRTVLAINLTDFVSERGGPPESSWFVGPPYMLTEHVFDETDYPLLEEATA